MRDKAVAQLETEKVMAAPQRISNEQYATLTSAQRREMLASAFSYVNKSGVPGATLAQLSAVTSDISTKSARRSAQARAKGTRKPFGVSNVKAQKEETRVTAFLRAAESVSGRAASLGFVLCLAREIVEPGHPGLFEQVVDVVVPIAQKTPPFLVAVADRLVDLLT